MEMILPFMYARAGESQIMLLKRTKIKCPLTITPFTKTSSKQVTKGRKNWSRFFGLESPQNIPMGIGFTDGIS